MDLSAYTELNICAFIALLNRNTAPEMQDQYPAVYAKATNLYRRFAHPVDPRQKTSIHVKYVDARYNGTQFIPGQIEIVLARQPQGKYKQFRLQLDHSGNIQSFHTDLPDHPLLR